MADGAKCDAELKMYVYFFLSSTSGCIRTRMKLYPVDNIIKHKYVSQVSCGARHSAVLTIDGKAFGCGCNKHRELGLDGEGVCLFTELGVPALSAVQIGPSAKITDLECGWWHTVVLILVQ
jgi:alpha-tubulin suppressor-like RCC1 family protein